VNTTWGGDRKSDQDQNLGLDLAARLLSISDESVRKAIAIKDCGVPSLFVRMVQAPRRV
jgi:hypothetical protein